MGQSVAEPPPPPFAVAADGLPDPLAGHPLPSAGPAVAAEGQADDLLSQLAGAEIDRMLAEADVEPAPPPPPTVVAVVAEPVVEPVAVVPPAPEVPAVAPPAESTAAVPVVAAVDLNAVLSAAADVPAAADTVPLDALPPDDGRLPLVLRPLELLSAPLDRCPDRVREAIGKVAVVTLVNAVAVIAYVALFRRHG